MDEPTTPRDRPAAPSRPRLDRLALLVLLSLAALIYQGYQGWIALGLDDTNHLETPLALATARQFKDGPSTLYGPFSGTHPEVLIHAPLYYRLAAGTAFPFVRLGVNALQASLFGGRALSAIGLLLSVIAAWKLARLDGLSLFAGAVASLLIASSPVFGSFGFTVRPDTLGIGLQTVAFGLVLRSLQKDSGPSLGRLVVCGIFFGLTACIKQHLIVAGGLASLLMMARASQGRVAWWKVLVGLGSGLVVIGAYYGAEQWVTRGWMWRSVYELPSRLRELAPASWTHVRTVFLEVAKRGLGEIALAAAVLLVGGRRALSGTKIDAALVAIFAAETLAMVPLCLASEGAYVNYAMPSVVWASIGLARALDRITTGPPLGARRWLPVLAAIVLMLRSLQLVIIAQTSRQDDLMVLADLLRDPVVAATPARGRYFVGKPQHDRLYGAVDLAHDEWLYRSYEQAEMAEPRSEWLKNRIAGPEADVSLVIVPSSTEEVGGFVPGISLALPDLGYEQIQQYGQYAVWKRVR